MPIHTIKNKWSDDLIMGIPFYDSFIFNNALKNSICVPQIDFTKPVVFIEQNELPFDFLIKDKMLSFAEKNKLEVFNAKSIYYTDRKDFKTYLTFRCINKRTVLNKPDLEHMSSNEFCFETWKEKNEKI